MTEFDANHFKREVKNWIRTNPEGSLNDFTDFCEEQIPPSKFASYQWLIDQTLDWYKHILKHREAEYAFNENEDATAV